MPRVWILVLASCAGSRGVVEAPVSPVDDLEIRIDRVTLVGPCSATAACATPRATLSLRSGSQPAKVRLLRVTIAGPQQRTLDLAARAPTVWTSAGAYEPWNETIDADQVMAIQYDLARVDWDHFGHDDEHVRATSVVVEVDGRDRVFGVPEPLDIVDQVSTL